MAENAEQMKFAVGTLYQFFKGVSNVFREELIERPDDFSADKMAAPANQKFFDQVRLERTGRVSFQRRCVLC